MQEENSLGMKDVAHQVVVDKIKIYLPFLQIELEFIKQFLKQWIKMVKDTWYLMYKFLCMRKAKIKILVEPQVRKTISWSYYKRNWIQINNMR